MMLNYVKEPLSSLSADKVVILGVSVAFCANVAVLPYETLPEYVDFNTPYRILSNVGICRIDDCPFTYDLEQMKTALQSPRIKLPASALLTEEAFNEWLDN